MSAAGNGLFQRLNNPFSLWPREVKGFEGTTTCRLAQLARNLVLCPKIEHKHIVQHRAHKLAKGFVRRVLDIGVTVRLALER